MRWQFFTGAGLAFAVWFAAGVPGQSGDPAKESKLLEGTWQAVRLEADGNTGPQEVTKKVRWIFTPEGYTGVGPEIEYKGKYTLDPQKKPKEIDLVPAGGKRKLLAIYKLQGDQLTLCIGETRPAEFTTKQGNKRRLYVLKRTRK